jgi:RNA polymerase sigma factor (sigma-70 family)
MQICYHFEVAIALVLWTVVSAMSELPQLSAESQFGTESHIQLLIERGLHGQPSAHDELLRYACERLRRLTRKMFHGFPALRRWEETDDIFQNAMLRLHRALESMRVDSVRHFFNLAAQQIRWELLDLAKHHFGPTCPAANHHTDNIAPNEDGGKLHNRAEEPEDLEEWAEFHAQVGRLSEEEREVVNLLYYEGLGQTEAAKILEISTRTLKRRWQSARLNLYEAINRGGTDTGRQ